MEAIIQRSVDLHFPYESSSHLQSVLQMLINLHDCGLVTASIAVIRRAENGHHIPILAPIVTLHDKLMRSCYQSQAVVVIESFTDILTKGVPSTSGTDTPSTPIIRITPEQITHRSLMGDFLNAVQTPDVVQGIDTRAQSSMEAKDLVVNQGGKGQVVEKIGKVLPHIRVAVLAQTLVIKTVHLCDLPGFMVTSQNGDAGRIADFESHKECNGFDGVVATIDVVT